MTSTSAKRAVVQPYNPSTDFDDVVNICKLTAHPSIYPAADILPYIYAIPYLNLEPETTLVLSVGSSDGVNEPDLTGSDPNDEQPQKVVGYIVGTANTQEFVAHYRSKYLISADIPTLASLENSSSSFEENWIRDAFLHILHEPEGMLHANHPGFLEKYPAHLHINILPSHQRQGYGGILMSEFLKELRKKEAKGVHLGMRADNTLAGNFYKKHGFEESADIEMIGTTWMVKGLKPTQVDGN